MKTIVAIYASPRRQGNTAALLDRAVAGARDAGAEVISFVLRDLTISPCLEIYACKSTGRCAIKDDFHQVFDAMTAADGLMVASPVFFYSVSAHLKALIDRFQSAWVKKHWIDGQTMQMGPFEKRALFICVGATQGKRLFDGILLTMRYFLATIDTSVWRSLLYRGLDEAADIQAHPEWLDEAYRAGRDVVETGPR